MGYFDSLYDGGSKSAPVTQPKAGGGYFGSLFTGDARVYPTQQAAPQVTSSAPAPDNQIKIGSLSFTNPVPGITKGVSDLAKKVAQNLAPKKAPEFANVTLPSGLKVSMVDQDQQPIFQSSAQLNKKSEAVVKGVEKANKSIDYTINAIKTAFPETTKVLKDISSDPLALKRDPMQAFNVAWDTVKTSVLNERDVIERALSEKNPSISKKIGLAGQSVAGLANIAFSPISALFAAADKVPVLARIVSAVTLPFTLAGEGGKVTSDKVIDSLPVSKEVKENLKPGVGEIFSLAAQMLLGKAVEIGTVKRAELIKKYGLEDAMAIEAQAKKLATENMKVIEEGKKYSPQEIKNRVIGSAMEKTAEGKQLLRTAIEAEKAGKNILLENPKTKLLEAPKEKYMSGDNFIMKDVVSTEKVKVNKMMEQYKKAAERFNKNPTEINLENFKKVRERMQNLEKSGVVSEVPVPKEKVSLKTPKPTKVTQTETVVKSSPEIKTDFSKKNVPFEEGATKVSGLSAGVEAKAIEHKLTKSLGDLPEYKTVNMKDQATKAANLIKENTQKAIDIALGKEEAPKGVIPESVFVAIEDMALKSGNLDLIKQLANSELTSGASVMGQRIRALGERNPDSPVSILRDVAETRKKAIEQKSGKNVAEVAKKVTADIKKSIKAPDRHDWGNFIKSITC